MVKIGPVVLEKKMLTHDARRTTDDDGRQPIAIGHLSDSGDLKSSLELKLAKNQANPSAIVDTVFFNSIY